jgi:uncharacterized phage protein gp47/JayE
MTYFAPYVDESGLHLPTYNDILEKRINDTKIIYGQDIYLSNDSPDYQMLANEALMLYEAIQAIQYAYNQMCPTTAVGVGLSSLVQLNGITRQTATYSTCEVILTGTTAVTITDGKVQDQAGYLWSLPSPITLQAAGSPAGTYYELTVTATCDSEGAISAGIGDISIIATPTAGWISVENLVTATAGMETETDAALRSRQAVSVSLPSQTMLAGTIAAIASLDNVTRYAVYENPTNSTHFGDSGVPFEGAPVHSITCVVEGGTSLDIAEAIYYNRGLGCYMNGDQEVDITDTEYGTVTTVRYYRPVEVPVYINLRIHQLNGYLTGTEDEIKDAVAEYINSLGIGDTLTLSSINYAALSVLTNQLKPTFSVYEVYVGESPSPAGTSDLSLDYDEVFTCDVEDIEIEMV